MFYIAVMKLYLWEGTLQKFSFTVVSLCVYQRMINRKIEFGLKIRISRNQFEEQNSLDAGIQDRSTSISIMYKIEEMSHEEEEEEEEDDESDKRI